MRMTISISDSMVKAMNKMILNENLNVNTKTEILRNSFIVYKLIVEELEKGNKIAIADNDNHIIKEIVINR